MKEVTKQRKRLNTAQDPLHEPYLQKKLYKRQNVIKH